MPTYALLLKAKECENVAAMAAIPDRRWGLKFACTACTEQSENFVYVDPNEETEVDGGTSNAAFSCKFCKNKITVSVDPKGFGVYDFGPKPQQVAAFVVRGGEPVAVRLEEGWTVRVADSDTEFSENVDLDDEWTDYDESSQKAVSVLGTEVTFERSSGK